jgi:hypothetical protein
MLAPGTRLRSTAWVPLVMSFYFLGFAGKRGGWA